MFSTSVIGERVFRIELSSIPKTVKTAGHLWQMSRVRRSVDGRLLRGNIKCRWILAKGRPRIYTSRIEDEALDQISRIIRYQGGGILTKLIVRFLLQLGRQMLSEPKNEA